MRGYGALVAGFVVATLLLVLVALLIYVSIVAQGQVQAARSYREHVDSLARNTRCTVTNVSWSGGSVLVQVRNDGGVPVKLENVGLFLDHRFRGWCGTLTCVDSTGNRVVSPGEELNISVSAPPPSAVRVLFGLGSCTWG